MVIPGPEMGGTPQRPDEGAQPLPPGPAGVFMGKEDLAWDKPDPGDPQAWARGSALPLSLENLEAIFPHLLTRYPQDGRVLVRVRASVGASVGARDTVPLIFSDRTSGPIGTKSIQYSQSSDNALSLNPVSL